MSGASVVNQNVASGASISLTIGTSANAVLVMVYRNGSASQFPATISGPSGSWTSVRGVINNTSCEINPGAGTFAWSAFLGYANATGSQTITFTFNGGTPGTVFLWAMEISGIASSGAILSSIGAHQPSLAAGSNVVTVAGGTGSDNISTQPAFALMAAKGTSGNLQPGTGFTQVFYSSANKTLLQSSPINATGSFDGTATQITSTSTVDSFQVALLQSGQVSYAFVQDSAACSSSAVTTLSTPAVTVTAGDWLFAVLWGNGQSATGPPTDGPGDTFSLLGSTGSGKLQVYACPSAVGGSTSVSFTVGGATNIQVYMAEYSGLGASIGFLLNTASTSSKSGTTVTGGAVNVTAVSALLWSMCMDASSDATAPVCNAPLGARSTALWACNSPFDLNAVGDQLVTVAGNVSPQFTIGNTNDTVHVFSAAVALASSIPSAPPLTQLFNRRQQLFFA